MDMWLASLAAKTPTPGGGAVAALAAAIAAAQLGMVTAYTTGTKWQDREARMQELSTELTELWTGALSLVRADAEAFEAVGAAYKLPKTSSEAEDPARTVAIQTALAGAAEPPARVAKIAARVVLIAEELVTTANPNIISDVAVAASMARAALESAIVNVEINKREIKDLETKQQLQASISKAEAAMQKVDSVVHSVRKMIGSKA